MKIAVVGATGMVGSKMIQILEERNFPLSELILVATEKSIGKELIYKGKKIVVVGMQEAIKQKPAIALFSAGGSTSQEWAPKFAEAGITVIDNSSAWRMDVTKKLIVPEINASELTAADKIIANPNCSTIQMVLALHLLHKKYTIKRIVVSTYQSVTGTGVKALQQLMQERSGVQVQKVYPYAIDMNVLPQVDVFMDNGYTKEELKMVNETRKILGDNSIAITATAVRVPVVGGHSESVNVEFKNQLSLKEVLDVLNATPGVVLMDDVKTLTYPMPLTSHDRDEVFVGRVRMDDTLPNTFNLWIVADNLRKGAATNAVQIAEYLVENKLIKTN